MNAEMKVNRNEINMNMRLTEKEKNEMGVAQDCDVSVYSLMTVAGGILLAVGAVVYSLIAM